VREAQKKMTGTKETVYKPDKKGVAVYKQLYELYRTVHDGFGIKGHKTSVYPVMKRLIEISDSVRKQK